MKYFVIVLLLCVVPIQSSAVIFNDLDGHWAEEHVYWATFDVPVFSGYPDGSYRPNQSITRAEFISMLKKLLDAAGQKVLNSNESLKSFTDLTENHWSYKNVVFLNSYLDEAMQADLVLSDIFNNSRLRPDVPITRYEVALLTHSISTPPARPSLSEPRFSDIPSSDQHYDRINELVENGMVSGYEDGTFRPDNQITRAEAAAMAQKIYNDLQYLTPDRLLISFPENQSSYQYPTFDMPENRQSYSSDDRRMDNVIATLEYRSIVGFIPRDEQDLYDSSPIETLWGLKNENYTSVIANNYYLLTHDKQLVQERKNELAVEALLSYVELENPNIDGFLMLIQQIEAYAPPTLIDRALRVYLDTEITPIQEAEANIRLSMALVKQNKLQEALMLYPPMINILTDYDMKLLLIKNEAVLRYQQYGVNNAIDQLNLYWNNIENEPRYWFYQDEIDTELTALIKQLKIQN